MSWASLNTRGHPPRLWWKELRQYTHCELIKTNLSQCVAYCTENKGLKFLLYYKMNFEAFNNLVLELAPFLQSSCLNPTRPQFKIRKIMTIVGYLSFHGFSLTHMVN
jgi:hypothetical protein